MEIYIQIIFSVHQYHSFYHSDRVLNFTLLTLPSEVWMSIMYVLSVLSVPSVVFLSWPAWKVSMVVFVRKLEAVTIKSEVVWSHIISNLRICKKLEVIWPCACIAASFLLNSKSWKTYILQRFCGYVGGQRAARAAKKNEQVVNYMRRGNHRCPLYTNIAKGTTDPRVEFYLSK